MPKRRELSETEKKHAKIAVRLAIFFGALILLDFALISVFFSWQDWVSMLLFSILFIGPAYIANAGMVIVGGGKPIDGGKNWRDGRRLFGDHKTWNGLIKGPLYIGIPISLGIFLLFMALWSVIEPIPATAIKKDEYQIYNSLYYFKYYFIGGDLPVSLFVLIVRIVFCSYGAAFGDLIGAFFKRRLDIKSGNPFWIIDQCDMIWGALLFMLIPTLLFPSIFLFPDIYVFIFLNILTPSVSVIANTIGYVIGLKEVPW